MKLALIGNCAYQALIDDRGRVVWLCWPRFDSSFVFGALRRRRARRQLHRGAQRRAIRDGAGVSTEHQHPQDGVHGRIGFVRGRRFRSSLQAVRAVLQTDDADPPAAPSFRRPGGPHPVPSCVRLRARATLAVSGEQPHPVADPGRAAASDDQRAAQLHRRRARVPAGARGLRGADMGRAARGGAGRDLRELLQPNAPLLGNLGQAHDAAGPLPARGAPLRAGAEAPPVRGHRGDHGGDHYQHPRVPRFRAQLGLPLLLAP